MQIVTFHANCLNLHDMSNSIYWLSISNFKTSCILFLTSNFFTTPLVLSYDIERDTFANSVDPDEMAHHEPFYQDLHCLPLCFWIFIETPISNNQGPVVQSIVSLTSLLKVKMLTVLVSTISNSQLFLLKKCE